MTLRRQIFVSFLLVSILPFIGFSLYLWHTNISITFDLHSQNLTDSTAIQANILEEHINKMRVRASRMAASGPVKKAFSDMIRVEKSQDKELVWELQKFMEDTLDSVVVFALIGTKGELVYASGPNRDIKSLQSWHKTAELQNEQTLGEIPLGQTVNNLSIITPVFDNGKRLGTFVVTYGSNFFLKTISGYRQVDTSNTFVFCQTHGRVVVSKQEIADDFADFNSKVGNGNAGTITATLDGKKIMAAYRRILDTRWVLASEIPTGTIYSQIFTYGLFNLLIFPLILLTVVLLSHRQSIRIMLPLHRLLKAVERFYISGASDFLHIGISNRTEIGYLADKFTKMATSISTVQDKLRESNYLYEALLHATYELRISIDYVKNQAKASLPEFEERMEVIKDRGIINAAERVQLCLADSCTFSDSHCPDTINEILENSLATPIESEACCQLYSQRGERWYRIIAVPILDDKGQRVKLVLHFEDITIKKRELLRLLHISQRDPLCQLLNKNAFVELAKQFTNGQNTMAAAFFIDLDNFKQINDTLGHAAGDELLMQTARLISGEFRATDLVARYGGDEFAVFAFGMNLAGVEQKAKRLVENLHMERSAPNGRTLCVTGSVGVCFSAIAKNVEGMLTSADAAMYTAKQRGKSQYWLIQEGVSEQ